MIYGEIYPYSSFLCIQPKNISYYTHGAFLGHVAIAFAESFAKICAFLFSTKTKTMNVVFNLQKTILIRIVFVKDSTPLHYHQIICYCYNFS